MVWPGATAEIHMARSGRSRRKVRYAIVGAGWIAQQAFMPAVAQTGNSEMTAIVTGDGRKAKALGRHYGIDLLYDYDGYDKMLADCVADAVYIALPNTMHRDYAVRAARAGLHVLCEKPMARTEADCLAMIKAARDHRVKLMIAYRLHFEPATVAAIELIRKGRIGEPRVFSSVFAQQVFRGGHRTRAELWAGPLPDMGCYPLNAVRHLFGAEPIEASAFASRRHSEERFAAIDEMVTVMLRFPGDRIATFTASYGMQLIDEYRVTGTKGDLLVQPCFLFGLGLAHRLTVGGKTRETKFPEIDQFGAETKYFSECILEDREPEPDGEEGLADVRALLAIEKAIRTGRAQPVSSSERPRHPAPDQVRLVEPTRKRRLFYVKPPGN
jgi:predicted dehydrogenase